MHKNTRKNVQCNIFNNIKKKKKALHVHHNLFINEILGSKTYGQNTCVNTFI